MATIRVGGAMPPSTHQGRTVRPRPFVMRNGRLLFVWAVLIAIVTAYVLVVPQFRPREQRTLLNSGLTLATASMGQTLVVLTGGIDLSIGPMVSLTNSIASEVTDKESPTSSMVAAAVAALAVGALGGLVNGVLVAWGRPGARRSLKRRSSSPGWSSSGSSSAAAGWPHASMLSAVVRAQPTSRGSTSSVPSWPPTRWPDSLPDAPAWSIAPRR